MTIQVSFRLRQFQPDKSQYQVTKTIFEPVTDFVVVVDVPLEHTYIYNAEKIIQQQLMGDKGDMPLFTPAGLEYVESQLLARQDKPIEKQSSDDIEWEEEA